MATGKEFLRSFSIDHILSNKTEQRVHTHTENSSLSSSVCQKSNNLPLRTMQDLPLPAELETNQLRSHLSQQYLSTLSAAPLLLNNDQHQQSAFAARCLPPPSSLLSPSWKPDIDALYHNLYLETLLQGEL